MIRLKTLGVLTGIVATLALSAAPASAWFRSIAKPAQSQGTITVISHGVFHYTNQGIVECPTNEIKAQYHIQTKGQLKNHGQEVGKQEQTTEGPHLAIQVKEWGKCESEITGQKNRLEAKVKECDFQIVQQKGSFEATGGIITGCFVKIGPEKEPLCEIQVPAGMEKQPGSNEGINVGLKEIKLSNVGKNVLAKANINGGGLAQKGERTGKIFAYSVGKNALCPLSKHTEEATLEGLEGEANELEAF